MSWTDDQNSSTETNPVRNDLILSTVVALGVGFAAAMSPCSQARTLAESRFQWKRQNWQSETCSNCASQKSVSSSEVLSIPDCPKDTIHAYLNLHKLIPSRVHETEDGSELIQFLGAVNACVDVYPNGDVVVIVEKGDIDEYYSLKVDDAMLVTSILRNAGVRTSV